MYPSQHLIFGTIFAILVFAIFPQIGFLNFFLIIASTVLIDVDHYLAYAVKKKDWNLKNSYKWFMENTKKFHSFPREKRNKVYGAWCFLHGIEILILLFLFHFVSKIFLFILVGFGFHLILDYLHNSLRMDRIDKFSTIYDYFKFKKLKWIEDC